MPPETQPEDSFEPTLTPKRAVLVGHLVISLPVVIIMGLVSLFGYILRGRNEAFWYGPKAQSLRRQKFGLVRNPEPRLKNHLSGNRVLPGFGNLVRSLLFTPTVLAARV